MTKNSKVWNHLTLSKSFFALSKVFLFLSFWTTQKIVKGIRLKYSFLPLTLVQAYISSLILPDIPSWFPIIAILHNLYARGHRSKIWLQVSSILLQRKQPFTKIFPLLINLPMVKIHPHPASQEKKVILGGAFTFHISHKGDLFSNESFLTKYL